MSNRIVHANGKKKDVIEGGRTYLNTLEMRLYVNNITLDGGTMPAAGTDECTDTGYALVSNPYPNAFATVSNQGKAIGVNPTFVFDHSPGDFTVHGVFFTDPNDSNATVFAQAAETPFSVVAAGQVFVVQALYFFDDLPA